ncbi:MAG: glycosyltransferase [Syntrophales bacterium]|nr:glycosyltransferase [Syntrophales bacterium]
MKKSLNILVISPYYFPAYVFGGPVPALLNLNKALTRLGHKLTAYTTNADGEWNLDVPLRKSVLVDGLPVYYFPRWWFSRDKKPFNIFFSPAMKRQLLRLKSGDFDLILVHGTWCDPTRLAAGAARHAGIPYIYYTYGCFEPWAFSHKYWKKRIYFNLIERRILENSAGIVVSNGAEIKQLHKLGIKKPIRKIPCESIIEPLNDLDFCSRERLVELYPSLRGRLFLLFLSRLHPKKGLDLLISAFSALSEEFPDWLLVLSGPDEGGYRGLLERMIADQGLGQRILFTGLVTGEVKAKLLSQSDCFVLPSYSEGFPVVVAEALGYGRPMVISTNCYVPEVGEEGAGLVVPPEKEALTIALRTMLGDASFRKQCASKALDIARRHFTWESVAEESLAFYREVM